jgi:hypothetical protein
LFLSPSPFFSLYRILFTALCLLYYIYFTINISFSSVFEVIYFLIHSLHFLFQRLF